MPKKPTAKVSPLKGMPVATWVKQKSKGWQTKLINALLATVQKAAPEATVSIKWSQPVFELNGPMVWIKPAKEHVTLGFWRGAELNDGANVLEGGDRMKHLKLREDDAVDSKQIAAFVREAAALNKKHGDPSRR